MQSNGQFGVPTPDVPPHYNPVSNTMNNNSSNTSSRSTSLPGSTQPLGHMLFNFSSPPDQHAPLSSSSAPPPSHGQLAAAPSAPVLLSKAGTRDGSATTELYQEANPPHQQQQTPRFPQFLQSVPLEQFAAANNARPEQEKQGIMGSTGQGQSGQAGNVSAQAMPPQHQLSLALDQEGERMECNDGKGNAENQQVASHPLSMGEIDQAEEGAGAGSRWPRQETVALLKIRADMDAVFRDTSVKRPLWDEVSRKMGELGYERNAKKCKEKFENVNKYYKRTKEGKVGRQDGKNYRFFTQLEALSTNTSHSSNSQPPLLPSSNNSLNHPPHSLSSLTPSTMLISNSISSTIDTISKFKASASEPPLLPGSSASAPPLPAPVHPNPRASDPLPFLFPFPISASAPPPSLLLDPSFHPSLFAAHANSTVPLHGSSPSSTGDEDEDEDDDDDVDDDNDNDDDVADDDDDDDADDDDDPPRPASDPSHDPSHPESKKRKRKTSSSSMMAFFEGLLKKVMDKQEQMQQKFLQALEKRETDRMIREEAWRRQEMARLSKEHDLRAQERTSVAARDAALISFLQKFTGQTVDLPTVATSAPIAAQPVQYAPPLHQESMTPQPRYEDPDPLDPNSKRWLKPEVLALIELHSNLQAKFTEAGPKGHLWEEIANGMAKLGYSSRTAKRCKEKWENINKYFKRAKDSNKKRPENAKTCPYFHELDALYRKGILGSSHVNLLTHKPSIEHAQPQIDDEGGMHQPSSTTINTGEGTHGMDVDGVRTLQAQQPASILDTPSDQGDTAAMVASAAGAGIATSARSGFTAELGLSSQQEIGKVSAGGEHENKPSVPLAPLPNSASFMTSMMQKINGSSAAASNTTTN